MTKASITIELELDETEAPIRQEWKDAGNIEVEVDLSIDWGTPAITTGSPEGWDPGEGASWEVEDWRVLGVSGLQLQPDEETYINGLVQDAMWRMDEDALRREVGE